MNDIEEFECIHVGAYQNLLYFLQPFVHLAVNLGDVAVVLVGPVSSYTFLGYVIHALRTYLHFDPESGPAHQSAVQSFVAVALGGRYPVSESALLRGVKPDQD